MSSRTIFIDTGFDTSVGMNTVTQLEKLDGESNEDIVLVIASYGGCVNACLAIHDAIQRCKCDVVTLCVGTAMSAGALVLASGTPGKRLVMRNAQVMFHSPRGLAELSDDGLAFMKLTHETQLAFLAERTGKSLSEVEDMLDRDHYLMAEDAVAAGVVDGIVGDAI